jgi:hypothetical protein
MMLVGKAGEHTDPRALRRFDAEHDAPRELLGLSEYFAHLSKVRTLRRLAAIHSAHHQLPLDGPKKMAKSTPVFAPGIEPRFLTYAVWGRWRAGKPVARHFDAVLRRGAYAHNRRDEIDLERKGRVAQIARCLGTKAAAHV